MIRNHHHLGTTTQRQGRIQITHAAYPGVWLRFAHTFSTTVPRSFYIQRVTAHERSWTLADITFLQHVLEPIYATDGCVSIGTLASQAGLSLRQLERRFQRLLGLSPKVLARLIRFEAFRDSLLADPALSYAERATRFGYQDQAHAIHEFKMLVGFTPAQFVEQARQRSAGVRLLPDPRPRSLYPFFDQRKVTGMSIDATDTSFSLPWQGIHHIAIATSRIEETAHFYQNVLGTQVSDIVLARGNRGRHMVVMLKPHDQDVLGLHFFENADVPQGRASLFDGMPFTAPFLHVALRLQDEASATTLHQRLEREKIEITDIPELGSFVFADNNGLLLEVTWPQGK